MTYRNTFAALAVLVCLLVCPTLRAARPTRPAHPPPRFATKEPHLRATHGRATRKTALAATRRKAAPAASRQSRRLETSTHAASGVRRASRSGKPRRISQDRRSVAHSSHARPARSARRQEPARPLSVDDAEVRARLRELDAAASIPSLLPPPRTLALYDERGRLI
ncbi:MAG TPA: hypothetical protein VII58_14320, partial [Acidobacteriaceae bacterium]